MRAFFINHSAASDHLGGSELSLLQLVDEWTRRDAQFEPVIVTPSRKGPFADEVLRRKWKMRVVDYGGWALTEHPGGIPESVVRIHQNAKATRRIIEWLTEEQPSLVVTNTLVAPWGALAASAVGIPHVWFVREFADADGVFHFPLGRARTLTDIGRLSTRVFANSNAVRDSLIPHIPAEKISVAYPPVDAERVRSLATAEPPVDPFPVPADLRVVMVGRITKPKGQWIVVEAIGRLAQRGVRVAVCFVGGAVERNADVELSARAAQLGVGDLVNFVGEQKNPFSFVAAADAGVLASQKEAFGRVTLECLILGRPVIATRTGGSPEIISHGRTGFLVSPGTATDDLADYLERYATDPELLRRHRESATAEADAIVRSGVPVSKVVEALTAEAAQLVAPLPHAFTSLLDLPEVLWASRVQSATTLVEARRVARRVMRISRHPVASFRRWRLRRRSVQMPPVARV